MLNRMRADVKSKVLERLHHFNADLDESALYDPEIMVPQWIFLVNSPLPANPKTFDY